MQTSLRLDDAMMVRVDALLAKVGIAGATRADVLRTAVERGVASMEAEHVAGRAVGPGRTKGKRGRRAG